MSRLRQLIEAYRIEKQGGSLLDESFDEIESLVRQYDQSGPRQRRMIRNHLERRLEYVGHAVASQLPLHERSMADLSGIEGADEVVQTIAQELQRLVGSQDPQKTAMLAQQLSQKFGSLANILQQTGADTAADLGPIFQQMLQYMV